MGGRCARVRAVALLLALGAIAAAPAHAGAQGCPEANPSYTDACGPTFVLPGWGDADGWTDPSQYSTIQLADLNGDGRDELIGRNDEGLEIWWFDTTVGQWRPQVDANGTPTALTAFASPAPGENPATDWTKPEYYSTIQTAQSAGLYGNPVGQVIARFADGLRIYTFTPGPGGSINGGSWALSSKGGPFSDASGGNDPSRYSTFGIGDVNRAGPGEAELLGRSHNLNGYWLFGSKFSLMPVRRGGADATFTDGACGSPSCFDLFRLASVCQPGGQYCLAGDQAVIGRTSRGVDALSYDLDSRQGGDWSLLPGSADAFSSATAGQFGDVPGGPDCPFPGTSDCLGSSPTYYDTFGVADFDGNGVDEVYARAADGLRAKTLDASNFGTWTALPTLTALAGAAGSVSSGVWGSIRTGDINGDHKDEVLALDGKGLEAWSYNATANAWTELRPSTPLALTGDWLTHPEYFSTIRVGDVDGDGRADVVARGPFGIRTWSYNRRGTGGWERYLAGGYPAFSGTATTGQQAAFAALNALALSKGAITSGQIRDVWTGKNPLDTTTLATLQNNLAGALVGNCSNETILAPPTYSSCVPPAGSNGFTAADWTAVVNEMLSEAYSAEQVVNHFADLNTIRQGVFESESGSLPAIASDLNLAGGAGNSTTFNLQNFFAGTAGIAASIAGLVPEGGAEVSAALWVVSELISMLPSASPTASSSFQGTYATLLAKLATAQDEMAKALSSQRQQVLGDQGLLGLVGRLRAAGTWNLDADGIQSASRQAFALQTYQALLPTMYNRYVVSSCTDVVYPSGDETDCTLPSGRFVTGSGTGRTWLGPPAADPCVSTNTVTDCEYQQNPGTMPDSIANIVWGPVSSTCNYTPPNKNTLWTYGCALGVPIAQGIVADGGGWTFTTESGDPEVVLEAAATGPVRATPGAVRATAARAGSRARVARAGMSPRAARDVLAPLRFTGRLSLSRGVRLRRMRVVVDRMLFDHGRREELARAASGRRLRPFALRHVRGGLFTARPRGGPRVRLQLRPLDDRGRARLDLTLGRVRTRDIRALCTVLPARVSRAGRPLELETRLRVHDAGVSGRMTMRQRWRCVRDRKGEFAGIRPVAARRPAARPGLALRLRAPIVLARGRRATVIVTVANRRRARPRRVVSSLWHLRITGTAGGRPQTIALKQLRAHRSRTLRFSLPVRMAARRQVCVQVTAGADSARPAGARRCVRIASAPRFTG